ncbi:hypothetical protein EG346_11590 [Chryseobacterium carnipullorum]|uniref:Uncharacterized protein n=1 Tax=Chryseobacterium carnipullorum TaxID=1124835 RepID=A0A1M7KIQ3_CHRCU|nr:hypothetical protein [Chryseobacterium carnipullorum]AZA48776.1 hypothetical protein EG346_11590 [Chryseobacterium carnipullorum]AZA63688.1 hypothetical protein EG345_02490 [Chryseobacterium carnipullorum]SHM65284.1 hypothetical protein SAMN05444360_11561 [Chryseobacterium carnipullorum]STC93150.1 Uncharacterised protein [Chryseobacterium carnipullorum]
MIQELNQLGIIFRQSLEITLSTIGHEDIDLILDNRDEAEFSNAWTQAYQSFEQKIMGPEIKTTIDEIRKEMFMLTFGITKSSDLSAYISDDIDLICSCYVHGGENNWIAHLLFTYLHHQIPQGKLIETDQTLNDLIKGATER